MRLLTRFLPVPLALLLLAGCGGKARTVFLTPSGQTVDTLLAAHPPDPAKNVTPILLDRSDRSSRHLVYVGDREQPHVHATHDLVVMVLRGHGTMWIDGAPVDLRPGDVAIVNAGTPHYFVNTGSVPAAAFVVFSPPFDGTDQVPVMPAITPP